MIKLTIEVCAEDLWDAGHALREMSREVSYEYQKNRSLPPAINIVVDEMPIRCVIETVNPRG